MIGDDGVDCLLSATCSRNLCQLKIDGRELSDRGFQATLHFLSESRDATALGTFSVSNVTGNYAKMQ